MKNLNLIKHSRSLLSKFKHIVPLLFMTFLILGFTNTIQASGGGEVDENTPTLTVSPNPSIHIQEGDSGTKTVSITISLDECPNLHDIKLRYTTHNNSATTSDNDYVAKSGNIVFSAGGSSCQTTVDVIVKGDTNEEANEKFYFDVYNDNTDSNQKFNPNQNKGLTDRIFRTKIYIDDEDTPPEPPETGADLNIWKSTDPANRDTYDIDDPITFKIVATNQGPESSTIKVTDLLPSGLILDSISDNISAQFSCHTSQTIYCSGSHVFGVGESVTVTVVAHSSTAGSYRNVAVVSDKNGNQDTIDTSDNSDYEDIVVAPGGRDWVEIEKELLNSSTTYTVGDTVEFQLTVTNHGLDKRIALRDKFPLANTSNPNGKEWGTTYGAFELVGILEQPNDVTCENLTSNGNPYIFCYTNGDYTHNQSFSLKVQAKVLRANRVCNGAHAYEYYWHWKDYDDVCFDVAGNNAPILAQPGDQTVTIGDNIGSFALSAYDSDGDALVYSISGLPDGLSLDTATGVITGTPSDSNTLVDYTVTVTVTDQPSNGAAALSDTKSFVVTVLYPEIHAYDDTINMETNSVKYFNVLTRGQNDEGYLISVTNYNPTTFTEGNLTQRNVDGRFKFEPIADFLGTVRFEYTITDSRGNTDTAQVTINVGTDYEDDFADFVLINPEDTRNILGNYAIAGNTIECITNSKTDFDGTCTDNQNVISNDFVTKYIDIDGDEGEGASTWNSSSSYITIPSQFDKEGKGILWAALFWQGRYTKDAGTNGVSTDKLIRYGKKRNNGTYHMVNNVTSDNIKRYKANNIKLKIDTGTYNDIEATILHSHRSEGGVSYAAYADVTNEVKNAITQEGRHTFTVANLSTAEGFEIDPGLYGGWSIVVIYAETSRGKARNISVYSGYDQISNDDGERSTDMTISGFKLPAFNKINSTLALFSGEGEYPLGEDDGDYDRVLLSNDGTEFRYPNNTIQNNANPHDATYDNIFDAKLSNITRDNVNGSFNKLTQNNTGIDIDFMDVSDVMTDYRDDDQNISSVNIKWETNYDTVNPSMMVFSAELYIPKLCYDYSYKQNGITFSEDNNGTEKPYIKGERLSTDDPITVELFIRNEEASDATLQDVTFDIYDINTSQATYQFQSTYITYPNTYIRTLIDDASMSVSSSHINDMPLGDIAANDSLYIDYDIGLVGGKTDIDMPLDGRMNFTLRLGSGINYDLSIYLESMKVCGNDRYAYYPHYDIFNIEDKKLADDNLYDLPTQIVNRVGDYAIKSYSKSDFETPKNVTTMVAVELVDIGKYHDVNASCFEPDNILSPRVWIPFENNVSRVNFDENTIQTAIDKGRTSDIITEGTQKLSQASDFYDKARENVAFRISYLRLGEEGDVLQLSERRNGCPGGKQEPCYAVDNFSTLSSVDIGNGAGNCIVDMKEGNDKISQYCGSTALIDGDQLPECLECIYGKNIQYVCSRDNFAMRPKSFRIILSDQNQTDDTQPTTEISKNNNSIVQNIVAGYNYKVDLNATNYIDDVATPGYFGYFAQEEDSNNTFTLVWQDVSGHNTNCADTEDANLSTVHFYNGGATNREVNQGQVGQYLLSMVDKDYTRVDWYPKYMKHQLTSHFKQGIDCIQGSSIAQPEGTVTDGSSADLESVNGCEIASDLTGDTDYTDMLIQLYPYTFNQSGLAVSSGPTNKSFIYIDTPSTVQSENTAMSYNFIGTYYAAGYNGTPQLTNFTNGCWAEDTLMNLGFTYNHAQPANTPFLSYSLQDTNGTDTTVIYKPAGATPSAALEVAEHDSISTPFVIAQEKAFYNAAMSGAIRMDLGFNFNRQNNLPLEPRSVKFNDFTISYATNPTTLHADGESTYTIKGVKTMNQDVTFLYGRAKPSKTLYDNVTANSINTPISIVAYCALGYATCQSRGFALLDAQTDQGDWWLSLGHVTADDDGEVFLKIDSNGLLSSTQLSILSNATDTSETVTANVATRPVTTTIDLDTGTNKWLIYNPLSPTVIPSPFYRVRFIGESDWAGHGDTGHVVGGNVNIKKNQRLGW